jgi:hypothetical protein
MALVAQSLLTIGTVNHTEYQISVFSNRSNNLRTRIYNDILIVTARMVGFLCSYNFGEIYCLVLAIFLYFSRNS